MSSAEITLTLDSDPPRPVVVRVDEISARWENYQGDYHTHTNVAVVGARTFQVKEKLDAIETLIADATAEAP